MDEMRTFTVGADTWEIVDGAARDEIADARTGYNGADYETIGAAIRGTAAKLQSASDKKKPKISPLFVNAAMFSWQGEIKADFVTNDTTVDYYFNVSGNAGDSYVTVESGGTADISTLSEGVLWAAAIQDDNGNVAPCVAGYNGVQSQLTVYPKLTSNIVSGVLSPWRYGIHLSTLGYKAYAQKVYEENPMHCVKDECIARYRPWSSDVNPFTKIGSYWWGADARNVASGFTISRNIIKNMFTLAPTSATVNSPNGFTWEVDLDNKSGYIELYVGVRMASETQFYIDNGKEVHIELYLDGVLSDSYVKDSCQVERVCLDFANAKKGRLYVYTTAQYARSSEFIYIGDCVWWCANNEYEDKIIPFGATVAQMFDSWGVFHDNASAKEFARLIRVNAGISSVPYENHSLGNQTSAWGRAWFYENVQKYHPSHMLIDFVINDVNSNNTTGWPATVEGPDGTTYENIITYDKYVENMFSIIDMAINNGIQPIICCGAYAHNIYPQWGMQLMHSWADR